MPGSSFHVAVGLDHPRPASIVRTPIRIMFGDAIVPDIRNRNERRKLSGAAEVIDMEMSRDVVIDLLQARGVRGYLMNSVRIASAWVTGIDQNRFVLGRDDQRGAATFRIDPVNIKFAVTAARKQACSSEE